jgi:Cu-processing system ATP-binding protein
MVEIRRLTKSFGRRRVLRGVSLTLPGGAIVAVVGPNASGKTTLLKCIVGLVIPDDGDILVNGLSVRNGWEYRRALGFMAQAARFPEHLSVAEVLALVQEVRGEHADARLRELVAFFELGPFLEQPVSTLSGGTRQKLGAAVSLLFDPRIVILDEPTAALDPLASSRLKDRLRALRAEGRLVVISSHHVAELEDLADRIVLLLDGNVRFDGEPGALTRLTGEARLERAVARLMERGADAGAER